MKFANVFASLAVVATARCTPPKHVKTTNLYGVEVVDTDLVRDARAIISKFDGFLYKHSMRTWLFGAAAINANKTLLNTVDRELHAVATILHDLGWDSKTSLPLPWGIAETNHASSSDPQLTLCLSVSGPLDSDIAPNILTLVTNSDHRFEIDGAVGAVNFVKKHKDVKNWDEYRLEKLHDGIALHASPGLNYGKNQDVQTILASINFDNPGGRAPEIPEKPYNSIVKALPNNDILAGTNETWTWLAQTKPDAVYNTVLEPFGTAYVSGFNATGHRVFDLITQALIAQEQAA
ncbi:hypothetical protein F5Y01DRAFT_249514 [Xylaria sp. FL0043]|nr:hypothetical protein F5Y01DRAFT_249514 [Xylaria sp. FL0043]